MPYVEPEKPEGTNDSRGKPPSIIAKVQAKALAKSGKNDREAEHREAADRVSETKDAATSSGDGHEAAAAGGLRSRQINGASLPAVRSVKGKEKEKVDPLSARKPFSRAHSLRKEAYCPLRRDDGEAPRRALPPAKERVNHRRKRSAPSAASLQSFDDLPLALSTLEDASVEEALSLDSNISEVIEAVANGDIKAFAGDRFVKLGRGRDTGSGNGSSPGVGRGPVKGADAPPSEVRFARGNDPSTVLATLRVGRAPSCTHTLDVKTTSRWMPALR